MASYQGHLMFSSMLGAAYGSGAAYLGMEWGIVFLGAGLTTLGGLLPDLDSDSGVPVRELFGLAAVVAPLMLVPRLPPWLNMEQRLVVLGGLYLLIRYPVAAVFKRVTVHRGMFHSIPALLITGLAVYLAYDSESDLVRITLALGTMLGFLSHLVLDELCSVDFTGATVTLNKFAGSAVKFFSPSWMATLACYSLLGGLGYLAWLDLGSPRDLNALTLRLPPAPSKAVNWSSPEPRLGAAPIR
jgi:membrane-bound metal-dependent hydrolase YbcI (DUF457 family)